MTAVVSQGQDYAMHCAMCSHHTVTDNSSVSATWNMIYNLAPSKTAGQEPEQPFPLAADLGQHGGSKAPPENSGVPQDFRRKILVSQNKKVPPAKSQG